MYKSISVVICPAILRCAVSIIPKILKESLFVCLQYTRKKIIYRRGVYGGGHEPTGFIYGVRKRLFHSKISIICYCLFLTSPCTVSLNRGFSDFLKDKSSTKVQTINRRCYCFCKSNPNACFALIQLPILSSR